MEQNKENTSSVSHTLKEYSVITLAVLIMDIGIYVFKFPNNFSFGGVSGMAVVFSNFLPFTASVINLFINLVLLVVGFAFLGRNFGLKTAYVTVLSSVLLNVFEHLFPMSGPLTDQISWNSASRSCSRRSQLLCSFSRTPPEAGQTSSP